MLHRFAVLLSDRHTSRLVALCLILLSSLALAQSFDSNSRTVTVAPSGGDDTHALQSAFDICAAVGDGCTVRLNSGTFLTRQLIIRGFQGTFTGAGADDTIIEPFGRLVVNDNENVLAEPPSADNPWPALLLFIDANAVIRDVGFRFTEPELTTVWHIRGLDITSLSSVMVITGSRSRVDVERISVQSGEGNFFGVNVINGIYFQGILPGPSGDVDDPAPLSGIFSVKDSEFLGPDAGVLTYNLREAALVVSGNVIEGNLSLLLEDSEATTVVATDNDIRGAMAAVFIASGSFGNQASPLTVLLRGNRLSAGPGAFGVQIVDLSEPLALEVTISGNEFVLDGAAAGVMGLGSVGTIVRGNTFVGSAAFGMQIGDAPEDPAADPPDASNWLVAHNDWSGLSTETAQVWVTAHGNGSLLSGVSTIQDEGTGTLRAGD